jgi:thiosulfate/3-mercaptopyruvate sulfurtransferase
MADLPDFTPDFVLDSMPSFAPNFAALNHWTVEADWLYRHLNHPQMVIIDCRFSLTDPLAGQQQYEISHLPGAHFLDLNQDLSSPVQPHGGRHPLPQPEILAAKLTAIGVSSAPPSLVVIYDDSRFAFAARLWWLLRYYSHDQVVVLDGGYSQWQAAGYPVTTALPPQPDLTSPFIPQLRTDWTIDITALKQVLRLQSQAQADLPVLIDAREAERYRGEREPIDPVAGHIPGALNYPWQEVTDHQGFVHSPAIQQQRWANLPKQQTVLGSELSDSQLSEASPIVYCGSGVTACVNLLSLAIAGRMAKLYPGSWSDWCSYL